MAEIIDIRGRLKTKRRDEKGPGRGWGTVFRLRLCGPDLRWIGLVGGVLGEAFALEGFCISFADLERPGGHPVLDMRAGRQPINEGGAVQTPGLVVAGAGIVPLLRGCDGRTVLLGKDEPQGSGFPGKAVPIPALPPRADSLQSAVASVAAAARLTGVIGWDSLDQALREELSLSPAVAVEGHLHLALEAYRCAAEWEGIVAEMEEEI